MTSQPSDPDRLGRPGPKPTVTRALLLEAGRRVVKRATRDGVELAPVLGLTLASVIDEATQIVREQGSSRRGSLAQSVLYKHWNNLDEFALELTPLLFDAAGFDLAALKDERLSLDDAVARHMLADREQIGGHDGGLYFGMFRMATEQPVGQALREVYSNYDTEVVPALAAAIERAERRPRRDLGAAGVAPIAAALTALTEGLALRALVEPEAVAEESLWTAAGVALVLGMTEEV